MIYIYIYKTKSMPRNNKQQSVVLQLKNEGKMTKLKAQFIKQQRKIKESIN